jgi:3',5'-cyclic AMP phosphodiesterase CpdA
MYPVFEIISHIMNKAFFLLLAFIIVFTGCKREPEPVYDEFTFAFLTDIHVQYELRADEGFRKVIDTLNRINPDFILTGGDLVMDVLDQTYGRSDSLYDLYMEMSGEFNMPVYNTIGNHEIYGWHRQEEGIQDHEEFGKKMFEKRIGQRYYTFDHKGWHFIVLDAMAMGDDGHYIGKIDDKQVEWLKQDLRNLDKKTPIAVSVHMPFITSLTQLTKGSLASNSPGTVITNARDVLLLFYEYNLKIVLQGHLHFLEDIYVGNKTHFITAGAVSGRWWKNRPGTIPQEGFLLVRVKGEEFEWEYVDYGWTTEFEQVTADNPARP